MRRSRFILVLLVLLLPLRSLAAVLEYSVEGLEGEPLENVLAWLGEPPDTAQARQNFMATAEDRVVRSLQALGYYRPQVELQLERGEPVWQLLISVQPGEPVRIRQVDLRVTGEALQDEAFTELLSDPPLVAGEVLHHGTYETFKRRLQSLGQRRGFFDGAIVASRVEVEPLGATADVQLHYDSGVRYRFGPLRYDQDQLHERLLLPLLEFEEGAYFEQGLLQSSQAMLQRTGYFSAVLMRPLLEEAAEGLVPVQLELFPAKRHSFDVGIGYSTDTEERVSVTWRTPRINRSGHSQETRIQYSAVNPSGRFTYTIPLSHPLRDILQLWARVEDNEFGDLDSSQEEIGARREQRLDNWVWGYSLRGLDEGWEAEGVRFDNDYLLPGLSLSRRDHIGPAVNPDSGFSQLYRLELAGADLGSDVDLLRAIANFGHISSLGRRHRLVSRLELGVALLPEEDRADLAPSLNFFAGGSQSIRGYSYQSIGNEISAIDEQGEEVTLVVGGDRLLTASVEYQYRFNENWRGALFVDGGDAFDEGEFDLNVGAGFGVHYITQVGAVRLELANPVTKDNPSWRFHLAIGAEF